MSAEEDTENGQLEANDGRRKLIRSRGGHKAFSTKIINETEELLRMSMVSGDESVQIENELLTNQQTLEDKMEEIGRLDDQILDLTLNDELYQKEMLETADYKRRVVKTTIAITNWLRRESDKKVHSPLGVPHSSLAGPVYTHATHSKLARLPLPEYGGDPLQFQAFWDRFQSAVHNNQTLQASEKFDYLKSALKGRAVMAFEGLTLTAEIDKSS